MIVYIASPYSRYANKQDAVSVQVDTFAILRDLGYQPIAPLLSHYIDQRHPTSYERWMQWCLAMVRVCDVVLRLPGESVGADREVAEARRLGKPVVHSIDDPAIYEFFQGVVDTVFRVVPAGVGISDDEIGNGFRRVLDDGDDDPGSISWADMSRDNSVWTGIEEA